MKDCVRVLVSMLLLSGVQVACSSDDGAPGTADQEVNAAPPPAKPEAPKPGEENSGCGGIAPSGCNEGLFCKVTASHPDAAGVCTTCPAVVDCELPKDPNGMCSPPLKDVIAAQCPGVIFAL
jgi:hypothetical protein